MEYWSIGKGIGSLAITALPALHRRGSDSLSICYLLFAIRAALLPKCPLSCNRSQKNYARPTRTYKMSESAPEKRTPVVTYTVIGICVLIYVWELVNRRSVEAVLMSPLQNGGLGAAWTLFTTTFVHSPTNPTHIVFNLLAFSVLGRLIETIYGPTRLAVLLIALSWVASAAQLESGSLGIGLSGVVYGVFGFMIGASPSNPFLWWFVKKNAVMLIGWAVISVVLTQTGVLAIGNYAHFGGLFYGAICGLIYGLPRYRYLFIGLAIIIPIILGAMLPGPITSEG
jgi:membrane associated rhomboid family serine protease